MTRVLALLLLGLTAQGWAQTLGPSAELTLNPPWSEPVTLLFPAPGLYRLEAAGLAGSPVEVQIDRQGPDGFWTPAATNRSLRGVLEASVEWSAGDGSWRVRPVRTVLQTVVLRLRPSTFAGLRETLRQGLTPGPEVSLPLVRRGELPVGTGGPVLAASPASPDGMWIGWLTQGGRSAEVWTAQGARLGSPIVPRSGGLWTSLAWEAAERPILVARGPGGDEARSWTGLEWVEEAVPGGRSFTTPEGTFRYSAAPVPRVWRYAAAGWTDLELPQNQKLDRMLLGSTDEGLYALLASSAGRDRAFYLWKAREGWTALDPPPAAGPPLPGLWAAANGAGALLHLEAEARGLVLRSFDGTGWGVPLDLSALGRDLQAVCLLPPSRWSRTGTLIVVSDRVSIYDLP